jgi:hypothetical protein
MYQPCSWALYRTLSLLPPLSVLPPLLGFRGHGGLVRGYPEAAPRPVGVSSQFRARTPLAAVAVGGIVIEKQRLTY